MDRKKYMDKGELKQLRHFCEVEHIMDLRAGRIRGVLSWMLVDTALTTGLRVSELAALKIRDIDLKRGFLSVIRRKKKKAKTESLAISKELVIHLKDYIGERTDGMLFVGKRGDLSSQGLQQLWRATIKRAGLPKKLSIHTARHTLAVHLLKKTGNLRQVQKQLGHSSPVITANMYADISFEDMREGLNGLYADEKC